jgi:A/G-specific adenine glycosylase
VSPRPPQDIPLLAGQLTAWYRAHRRDLPWRRTRDPYAIWVSEVMLQQTQVQTVLRYWEPFMARFPDVVALANAPQDDVMAAWSGLGYYRRARLMHQAAQVVRDAHGGRFPVTPAELRALPGVGAYTQGALLSIAFDTPAPAVDGNVNRVLSRLRGFAEDPRTPDAAARITLLATQLSHAAAPSDVTQGLMELGATVCTPARWDCEACPWAPPCVARARGLQDVIPPVARRTARKTLHVGSALVVQRGRLWLVKRGTEGLFGGLWQLPSSGEVKPLKKGGARAQQQAVQEALLSVQPGLTVDRLLCRVERTLTHRDLVLWVFAGTFRAGARALEADARQVAVSDVAEAPLSTAMRTAIRQALAALAEDT